MPATAPYGSWKSPITTELIVAGAVGLGQIALDGADLYWAELRPAEGGRVVIVRRRADGEIEDVTPPPYSARTRVHEYGGGAFLVDRWTVYFSNFADQRLYRQAPGQPPQPITPEAPMRYADGIVDRRRRRIICVREDHSSGGEPANALVSVDLDGERPQKILYADADFCSTPRLNPAGNTLAWLAWNHPNMPWDGCWLLQSRLDKYGYPDEPEIVAGGASESIFQPEWSPSGELHFVSDRSGWWNLYRWRDGEIQPLAPRQAEFGKPQWVFGSPTYGFLEDGRIACAYAAGGRWRLGLLDGESGELTPLATPYTELARGDVRTGGGRVVFVGGAPTLPPSLVSLDPQDGSFEVIRQSKETAAAPEYLSQPESLEFPTTGGRTAYALFYPPRNPDFRPPPGEKPPLLVKSHGGPTAAASSALDWGIQFWTSRGIGVVDVNYGGSVGYGTEYRRRLNGHWGVVDVDDCVNAALHLAARGDADPGRLAISGGSAGGYTTLAALTFREVFQAGASYYGVSDLEALAQETHKFEARYLDSLVGPYPERRELYRARSPIHHTERLSCPLALLQGLEDAIVPPNQAELMFEAVRAKGLPTVYVPFEGEQHGFRRAENIRRALEVELYFYSQVFGFELADAVPPVRIENLPE